MSLLRSSRTLLAGITHEHIRVSEQTGLTPLQTYRKICRYLPGVLKAFEIVDSDAYPRALATIRRQFEGNRHVTDPRIIQKLVHKADIEIAETILMHKTKSHVQMLVDEDAEMQERKAYRKVAIQKQSEFLDDFINSSAKLS